MTIKAEKVERSSDGSWTHSQLPHWEDYVPPCELEAWKKENSIEIVFKWMEDDEDCEFVEEWFEEGSGDFSDWKPSPPNPEYFLLSINDTEDGPISWWAKAV